MNFESNHGRFGQNRDRLISGIWKLFGSPALLPNTTMIMGESFYSFFLLGDLGTGKTLHSSQHEKSSFWIQSPDESLTI